ncbi:MAG: amidohydrolase [Gammaproteobacteria bacterium HGW-Gammaproteobacteria-4]|jgi:predicted amidohydrolase|nr:MAG: amidohydrolase [Gammaproteobacteria bacterium HGW-Gammaproteobacteria-4]
MSLPDLRVTLVQGETHWHDPAANRAMYGELARSAAGNTDLVILPETFSSGFSNEALADAETMDGPTVGWLRELSVELGAAVTGSVQIRDGEGVYNRLLWATPDGVLAHYDKRHLFRMAHEHERYAAGRDRLTVEYMGWRICPLVCYDLRFPVFIRNRFGHEVPERFDYDLLIFVANWPEARRHAWRTLLRARAIENLACVAAVNRVGTDGNDIAYSGDSVVLDQLGAELVEIGPHPHVATATLSGSALLAHRARFPAQLDADAFVLGDGAPT